MTRRILACIGSRANWSTLASVCNEAQQRADLRTEIVCYGSAVVDRYGSIADEIGPDYRLNTLIEGDHSGMVQTVAASMAQLGLLMELTEPDVVLVCGDRYEVLPAAYAAALQNRIVAHVMGGEVSGSIDESVRHAITKLAHVHFPATESAARRIRRMGEPHGAVFVAGCPRLDTVLAHSNGGAGGTPVESAPFGDAVVLYFHPTTTEKHQHAEAVLEGAQAAAQALSKPLHVIWPNSDAGREEIAAVIRGANVMTHRRTTPEQWARVLNTCAVLIGNSSSGLRDGAILGTPVVNVGDRQRGRECGPNVVHVPPVADAVAAAAIAQAKHGRYEGSTLYGDGNAAKRIVDVLCGELPAAQKVWAA